ncbi:MAG: GNAT family N-acetyltransferase [Patescibacteria group bacterium]|nr:GNAT family N-acetyltransferase [Patescibacteria group bacterium]
MENIVIREAAKDDFEWVVNLMDKSLKPYYDGDNFAHAKRIFDAHINGGQDYIGFFSFEQRMFIIRVNEKQAGVLHLVGKRQSTYKISPLIIASEFQGLYGLGSRLLEYAEEYSLARNARQLYCTVAEKNISAMQFFLRKGFIKAGDSDSHYKNEITEAMLYKPLYKKEVIEKFDRPHISVLPLNENDIKLKKQVSQLLLENLPVSFAGIDNEWIESLFSGYSRRKTTDINLKYKLIYCS